MKRTIKIGNLVDMRNGQVIMPEFKAGQPDYTNRTIPNPYGQDVTQQYPVGAKFVLDERRWRYGFAGATNTRGRLVQSFNAFGSDGVTREFHIPQAATLPGADRIVCIAVGIVPANWFAGGWALPTPTSKELFRIVSNTGATVGLPFTVVFDHPAQNAIPITDSIQLIRDKWADVRYLSGPPPAGFGSCVGVAHWTVDAGKFAWYQTWGPCSLAGINNVGSIISNRQLVAGTDGAVKIYDNTLGLQYIGYLMPYTGPAGSSIDVPDAYPIVNLQIEP